MKQSEHKRVMSGRDPEIFDERGNQQVGEKSLEGGRDIVAPVSKKGI